MRLLVTGGAGFIGSAFVWRRLAATSDEIVVLDKLTYSGNRANLAAVEADPAMAKRFRFVQGDIADFALVKTLVDGSDAVLNLAAESHVDRSILDAQAFLHTGVLGVHALLNAVQQASRSVRFVQVSTDEVYGARESGRSVESDAVAPRSPYAAAKAAGELLVNAYRTTYGLDTVITRGANTYGPRQHPEKLIPLFVTNAIDDEQLPMYGDGLQERDWMHVDDHADAVGFVLDHGQPGETYNLTADQARTNRDVTMAILGSLDKPWSLVRTVLDRPGHDRRYAMDGAKIARLGWQRRIQFEDGLERTIAWYTDNQAWWRPLKGGDWTNYYRRQYAERLANSASA